MGSYGYLVNPSHGPCWSLSYFLQTVAFGALERNYLELESMYTCQCLLFRNLLSLNVNGFLIAPCRQERGLRQGDPLSPLLFNIALEPVLQPIQSSSLLPGFPFLPPSSSIVGRLSFSLPEPVKLLAYADDVLLFLT